MKQSTLFSNEITFETTNFLLSPFFIISVNLYVFACIVTFDSNDLYFKKVTLQHLYIYHICAYENALYFIYNQKCLDFACY